MPPMITKGTHVDVKFKEPTGSFQYYTGTILSTHSARYAQYDILFDDGDYITNVVLRRKDMNGEGVNAWKLSKNLVNIRKSKKNTSQVMSTLFCVCLIICIFVVVDVSQNIGCISEIMSLYNNNKQ